MSIDIIDCERIAKLVEDERKQYDLFNESIFRSFIGQAGFSKYTLKSYLGKDKYGRSDIDNNLSERIKEDVKNYDELVKHYLGQTQVQVASEGLIVTGELGRRMLEQSVDKSVRSSRCLVSILLIDNLGECHPFYYIIDNSSYSASKDLKRKFIHEITHWYIYKLFIQKIMNIDDEKFEVYSEALAFMAERDICKMRNLRFKSERMSEVHKKALEIVAFNSIKKEVLISKIEEFGKYGKM